MRLRFISRVTAGDDGLDTAIRGIAAREFGAARMVYAMSSVDGGVSAYRIAPDGTLTLHDNEPFPDGLPGAPARDLAVAALNGRPVLLVGGTQGHLTAIGLTETGGFGEWLPPYDLVFGPETVIRMDYLASAGDGMLALAGPDTGVALYQVDEQGALSGLHQLNGDARAVSLGDGSNGTIVSVLAPDAAWGARVSPDGTRTEVSGIGTEDGLPFNAPTAIGTVSAHNSEYIVAAAAGTDSLTVLELDGDGSAQIRDHLIDTRFTRFADPQDIAVTKVNGQVFVVAGGSDEGVTLFTLLPSGRLLHLDSLASDVGASIDGVTNLHMQAGEDMLHILAATQGDPGLAHLGASLMNLGLVNREDGRVEGGAGADLLVSEGEDGLIRGGPGNDILVAAKPGATLTGGPGRDVFVLRADGGAVHITDFETGEDRLDLSGFGMLRNPGQLDIAETETGARIAFRDELVTLDSQDGAPIASESLFTWAFSWPDRIGSVAQPDWTDTSDNPPPVDTPNPQDPISVMRTLNIGAETPDAWLSGARARFVSEDGEATTLQADAEGQFDLSGMAGESGQIEFLRDYHGGDALIGVDDALNILRLAVGLQPSFGPATPTDLLAADIDGDGAIGVDDALNVLRVAVGLETEASPEWLYLDPEDPIPDTGTVPNSLSLDIAETGDWQLSATVILTGNLDGMA